MKSIVTLTINAAIDKSAEVDRVAPEIKLRCHSPRRDAGGGGLNVSRVIKRLGGDSLAIYPAGGMIGELLKTLLDQEGIRQHPIPVSGETRENFTAYDNTTGQQYRFNMPGTEMQSQEWQASLDALRELDPAPDYVIASGSLPPGVPIDFYRHVAQITQERGSRLILDTSGDALLKGVAQVGAFLLKPNMRELGQLAETEIKGEAHLETVARSLIQQGTAEVVVVSLGAAGAMLVEADSCTRLRAPTVQIQSAVGAGDSMVAGMAVGFACEFSMPDAVQLGVITGAAAVMTPGTDLAHFEDVARLYEYMTGQKLQERLC